MRNRRERFTGFTAAVLLASVVAVIVPTMATAQVRHGGHVHGEEEQPYDDSNLVPIAPIRRQSMVTIGGGFGMVVPQGEFGRFVGNGYGASFNVVTALEPSNTFALRFDGGFANYGTERYTLGGFGFGPVGPNIRTTNNIATFGVGPQLQLSRGPIRPYINGFVGMGYFWTQSSANDGWRDFARTLNYDDWAFGYGGGGGIAVQLGAGSNLLLTFDAQYRRHDNVQYLRPGSIVDDGFGGVFINPIISNADFLTFQMGMTIGL
ncbi:MAG: hypothetical protein ACC682_16875 [Gemmatimonadota bacterium]